MHESVGKRRGISAKVLFPLIGLMACGQSALSQTCAFPPVADFKPVEIFKGMTDPSHMSVLPDGSIFAIEQWSGKVHLFTPGHGASVIGTVPTNEGRNVEEGMLGIAADIHYSTTHWIYILHTPATLGSNRLTRYSVINGALANPKLILDYPRTVTGKTDDQRHAGGGMAWNRKTGDLLISTGDDTNPFTDKSIYGPRDTANPIYCSLRTAANTNDLRGKTLRIRPIPFADSQSPTQGVGSTYTIPPGNLFPPGKFTEGKTRPEIYTMGHRNAYRVKVDSVTGWVFVGEVGADADLYDSLKGPPGYDKITLFKAPGNAGWPFSNGNLEPYKVRSFEKAYQTIGGIAAGKPFDLANLKNLSHFNTGLTDLPSPPVPPLVYYCKNGYQTGLSAELGKGGETAIAGPTYDFNPNLVSAVKLPPFFHRKVIFGDFTRHYIWLMSLDTAGALTALDKIMTGPNVIDMDIGPDGTLYYLDYAAGAVFSLTYTGNQKDYKACSFIHEGCMDKGFAEYDKAANLNIQSMCQTPSAVRAKEATGSPHLLANLSLNLTTLEIPAWAHGVEVFSIAGKLVFADYRIGSSRLELPANLSKSGLLYVNFLRK